MPDPVDLAVVVTDYVTETDLAGVLVAPTGEILYGHSSISIGSLRRDLTLNHGRRAALDERYPQGWTVSIHGYHDSVPAEIIRATYNFYLSR